MLFIVMKILSIDIGIKHLAFCLFNIKSKTEYSISKWDIINLCNEEKKICEGANEKSCGRTPRFTKNSKHYCKIHARHHEMKIPSAEYKLSHLNKRKLHELKDIYNNLELSTTTKLKETEYLNQILEHLNANYLEFIIPVKAKDFSITKLGRSIKANFTSLIEEISIDHVIVENQIGPLANRMKTIQGMVMQHFIEKGVETIREIAACNKLKNFIKKGKTTYNQRKQLGIHITKNQLAENANFHKWQQFFMSHKKKDDLADSFLQGVWYLSDLQLI